MSEPILAVIPARYASERLPGKPLLDLGGKPLIAHTITAARSCPAIDNVVVATDHEAIAAAAVAAGAQAVMTASELPSGTDRIGAAIEGIEAEIILNIQGDEPETDPEHLALCIQALREDQGADIATLAAPLTEGDLMDPDCVKVVWDERGRALYFSRAPLGQDRESLRSLLAGGKEQRPGAAQRHLGIYAYRRKALMNFLQLKPSQLEGLERLEQLRALENGMIIAVRSVDSAARGVDTSADLERVRARFSGDLV